MKKKIITMILAMILILASTSTVFAAGWQKNANGWWYGTNADNTAWYSNGWQWIDAGNGVMNCYYFDANGYMLANTTTPDGYTVNADGAWVNNGTVATKQSTSTAATDASQGLASAYNLCGRYDDKDGVSLYIRMYDKNIMNVILYRTFDEDFIYQPGKLDYTLDYKGYAIKIAADGSSVTLNGEVYEKQEPGDQQYNANNGWYEMVKQELSTTNSKDITYDKSTGENKSYQLYLFYKTDGTIHMYRVGGEYWGADIDQNTMRGIKGDRDTFKGSRDGIYFGVGDTLTIVDDNTVVLDMEESPVGDDADDYHVTETYKR